MLQPQAGTKRLCVIKYTHGIKEVKGNEVSHHEQDGVSGPFLRRRPTGEARVVDVMHSPAVTMQETHHVDASQDHKDY